MIVVQRVSRKIRMRLVMIMIEYLIEVRIHPIYRMAGTYTVSTSIDMKALKFSSQLAQLDYYLFRQAH